MRYQAYSSIEINEDFSVFDFISTGPKGEIWKHVAFLPMEDPTMFNLAFGYMVAEGHVPDDKAVSNNGDRNKIQATVTKIIVMYTNAHPQRWVFFNGSTDARTRLYQMAITINLSNLSKRFEIFGLLHGQKLESLPFD